MWDVRQPILEMRMKQFGIAICDARRFYRRRAGFNGHVGRSGPDLFDRLVPAQQIEIAVMQGKQAVECRFGLLRAA